MSCGSKENFCGCGREDMKEGFNAGTPPYLGYAGYPGSDFPNQCGGGYGYGGYGHYGTYGGCAKMDTFDADNAKAMEFAELDSYNAVHEPGCWCPQCQAPYSMPYQVSAKACGNPYCKCGDCDGNCKCGAQVAAAATHSKGLDGSLVDFGLTNGRGLKGHLHVPGVDLNVDFNTLLRYAALIFVIAFIAYYLLGLRLR